MATESAENLDDNIEEICTATAKMEFSKVRVEMPDRVRNANFAEGMIKPDHDDSDNDDDHDDNRGPDHGNPIGQLLFEPVFYILTTISCFNILTCHDTL